ncbi:DUF924 family protein [Rugamonas aquatica]|uniref:DUF924 family protein n=1 Tax=Rugamonas aquatica TaxID=2743357 RepID=A0A6A7N0A8_9BURK|nr:DUF924 family protein [Rugamonas aquatica]MQA38437.1 DUF924 family protein [Rugamonas aquatica]
MTMNAQARAVFDFWFQPADVMRGEWFQKNEAFDREIANRFGALIEQALAGGLREWDGEGPQSALARILILDQFCRNVHRGTPLAFAGDPQALQAAQHMVVAGLDQALTPLQRAFAYLPFEHAEDMAMQDQSVALYTRMHDAVPATDGLAGMLDYAHRHREVVRRFGRFPHRNVILGRASTPEERAYLQQPGSGF